MRALGSTAWLQEPGFTAISFKSGTGAMRQVGTGKRHQASTGWTSSWTDGATLKLVASAPATAKAESSSVSFARMPRATSWNCWRPPRASTSACASCNECTFVTSACMPMRNHKSSPVRGFCATVKPRRSIKLKKRSPLFRRFVRIAVKLAPVTHADRRSARSPGSAMQPWLRKRQFLPITSDLEYPVIVWNFSDTAMSGKSASLGSAMLTQNWQSETAELIALRIRLSSTILEAMASISAHWWVRNSAEDSSSKECVVDTPDRPDSFDTCAKKPILRLS
mmetsp:Transcript_76962/g.220447  ORF Transcript_76962/g.220447 Transcript_76962/m.220447 type:complete len:280 (+) Transcript_76962:318-1157(+)